MHSWHKVELVPREAAVNQGCSSHVCGVHGRISGCSCEEDGDDGILLATSGHNIHCSDRDEKQLNSKSELKTEKL